jgi:dGTPase
LATYASPEAQIAAIADDIAYDAHDLDDGVRAGLFSVEDLAEVAELNGILRDIHTRHPGLDPSRRVHELIRRLIARMIDDVIAESNRRFAAAAPRSVEDVRRAGTPMIAFSAGSADADRAIKDFLLPRMYRHSRILTVMEAAQGVVADLFAHYFAHPERMPPDWVQDVGSLDEHDLARRIADFIAGMTDRYALVEHARYFDSTPELV